VGSKQLPVPHLYEVGRQTGATAGPSRALGIQVSANPPVTAFNVRNIDVSGCGNSRQCHQAALAEQLVRGREVLEEALRKLIEQTMRSRQYFASDFGPIAV
jgi:hypothetical protein